MTTFRACTFGSGLNALNAWQQTPLTSFPAVDLSTYTNFNSM